MIKILINKKEDMVVISQGSNNFIEVYDNTETWNTVGINTFLSKIVSSMQPIMEQDAILEVAVNGNVLSEQELNELKDETLTYLRDLFMVFIKRINDEFGPNKVN